MGQTIEAKVHDSADCASGKAHLQVIGQTVFQIDSSWCPCMLSDGIRMFKGPAKVLRTKEIDNEDQRTA